MRRTVVAVLVLVSLVSFALVPGMDKVKYGGSVGLWPYPLWIGATGYYTEGMEVYRIEDRKIYVDLFAGPIVGGAFLSTGYVGAMGMSLGLDVLIFVYKEDFSLDIFGYKVIPALELYAIPYYSLGGASAFGYAESSAAFDIYGGFRLNFLLERPESGEWMSFYFWPLPLVIGFDVVKF